MSASQDRKAGCGKRVDSRSDRSCSGVVPGDETVARASASLRGVGNVEEEDESEQYRALCGGPRSVQGPFPSSDIPEVCGGTRPLRDSPSNPYFSSCALRPASSLVASGAHRNLCSSRLDSSINRLESAVISLGWR